MYLPHFETERKPTSYSSENFGIVDSGSLSGAGGVVGDVNEKWVCTAVET